MIYLIVLNADFKSYVQLVPIFAKVLTTGLFAFSPDVKLLWYVFGKPSMSSHRKLFIRLHNYGIRGTVLTWLQISFFSCDWTHQTRVHYSLSDVIELVSGVVQGSHWCGPVNVLIGTLENHGISVKAFADDVKLYLRITNDADVNKLQLA